MTYEDYNDTYESIEIATLLAAMAIREGLTADDMKGWADTTWSRYWDMYDSADDNPTMMRNYKRMLDAYRYMDDYETVSKFYELDDDVAMWHEFYFYTQVTEMMKKLDEEEKAEEESEEESDNKEEKNMTTRIELEEFQKAVRELTSQAYEKFGREIEIVIDTWIYPDEPVIPKVSWASIGSQSIEDAAEFARKLKEATEMAAAFVYNGAIARWDKETDEVWYEMEKKPSDGTETEPEAKSDSETESMDFWDLMMKRTEDDRREYEQFKAEKARERAAATNLYDQIYAKIMDDNGQDEGGL